MTIELEQLGDAKESGNNKHTGERGGPEYLLMTNDNEYIVRSQLETGKNRRRETYVHL